MSAPAPIVGVAFAVGAVIVATSYIYHLELRDRREHQHRRQEAMLDHDLNDEHEKTLDEREEKLAREETILEQKRERLNERRYK